MEDDILTIEEVAKYLRVSDRTVYDWAQKGEIPAGKARDGHLVPPAGHRITQKGRDEHGLPDRYRDRAGRKAAPDP